eukprot:3657072-Prymnesium_polylepis.1
MALTCKSMADAARDALASHGLACASQLSGACCVCGEVHGHVQDEVDPTELVDGDHNFNDRFWLSDEEEDYLFGHIKRTTGNMLSVTFKELAFGEQSLNFCSMVCLVGHVRMVKHFVQMPIPEPRLHVGNPFGYAGMDDIKWRMRSNRIRSTNDERGLLDTEASGELPEYAHFQPILFKALGRVSPKLNSTIIPEALLMANKRREIESRLNVDCCMDELSYLSNTHRSETRRRAAWISAYGSHRFCDIADKCLGATRYGGLPNNGAEPTEVSVLA